MKILAINAGSSSLKFQLFEMPSETVLASGLAERISTGTEGLFVIKFGEEKVETKCQLDNHATAVEMMLQAFKEHAIIENLEEITGVGHRVVHGGETFAHSVVVTDEVEAEIESLSSLAPLHNPANLEGIRTFKALLPEAVSVAVFDTAFHQTMKPESYMYPLPYEFYTDYKVRKYGFHGTSHQFVSERTAELIGKPYSEAKIIVAHLGNGASLAAIDGGKSIDTSMGFTPLAGVMMGTRTGDIDPAITDYLVTKTGKGVDEITNIYNKQSGLAGVSGLTSDMRDVVAAAEAGHERAILALDLYSKRVAEYIAMYVMTLGGVDAIAFTAGVGENAHEIREAVVSRLGALGIYLDLEENMKRGEHKISAANSKVALYIVPTNEELVIARDTQELMK